MEQTHSPVDDEAVEAFIELWRDTGDKKTAIHKRCLFDLNYHRAAEEAQGRIRWRRPNTRPQKKYPNNQNSLPAARIRPTFQPKYQKEINATPTSYVPTSYEPSWTMPRI